MAYAAVQTLMHVLEGIMDADPNWVLQNKKKIKLLKEKLGRRYLREILSTPTNEVVRDLQIKIRDKVGFDDDLNKIKDWLTNSSSKLEVISIVGMRGTGKTTLARNVFYDKLIGCQFDFRSWVTVSREYKVRKILAGLLPPRTSEIGPENEEKLDEYLYKSLKGRRYLIVMDDIWDTKAWDDVRRLFPDDNNGSRIILTTQLENVGVYAASDDHVLNLSFLSFSESWNLLCMKVFGEKTSPYLVEIGQKIARLPLATVVVGGLLITCL